MDWRIDVNERWINLIENENYSISNKGRIRNSTGQILNPFVNNAGYYCIGLWKNNIKKTYCIHKLVAKYFMSNYNENLDIDHINNNKLDNNITNLQQITHKYNCSKRVTPNIYLVEKDGTIINTYPSYRIAGKLLGFSEGTLRKKIKEDKIVAIYNRKINKCMFFKRY